MNDIATVTRSTMLQAVSIDDLKVFASYCWGPWGLWVYDTWASHNEQYFDGMLKVSGIVWGLTPHGKALGQYSLSFNVITLHNSIVDPHTTAPWGIASYKLNEMFASDVLLHEMIHQKICTTGMDASGKSSHNNEAWAGEVTRIAKLLGLNVKAKPVKQKRIEGKPKWIPEEGCLPLINMACFPYYSVRPEGYYDQCNIQ